ncbi:MAG: diguanylate cyclase [Pirellulaceae bacterium]|nr:MAG: diguanylate cyclase [Pirellulaceae bacterium]
MMQTPLPRYNVQQTYDWNYAHPPAAPDYQEVRFPGEWDFCGLQVNGPLGIAAGPLLNGAWCRYYAALGWSVLTYKTVRSSARACYPPPNLVPVACGMLRGDETEVQQAREMEGTWAVSFGMPSQPPDVWRADVERTRRALRPGQVLVVSVVGTVQPGWDVDDLAADYARCARWAMESGADAVEANFSCPNVPTCDGQLYQQPEQAAAVAAVLRETVGRLPLIIKVGFLGSDEKIEQLLEALAPWADALSMTNSVALPVRGQDGRLMFEGQKRGICGEAIFEASLEQVRRAAQIVKRRSFALHLIGVGGVFTVHHLQAYLQAGAQSVQCATAAMLVPDLVQRIRAEWPER